MELEDLPGVGAKTAARLRELDDPEESIREGDVAALAQAPGVSKGRAARIARAAARHRHGDTSEFLVTARAHEIYEAALGLLQERAVTDYGRQRLRTFYPSSVASRIEETQKFARAAMDRKARDGVLEQLSDVEPLETPTEVRIRNRCLATTDAETYASAREAVPEMSVELVEDTRGLADLARGYTSVIALDEEFAGIDVEGDIHVEPNALDDPPALVPERSLAFFAHNRQSLRAAAAVHRAAELDPPCDLDVLDEALAQLQSDGRVAGDEELDRLTDAVTDLKATVSMAESTANDRLRTAIEERDVTIEGADLLSLVERGAGADSLLQRELADEYDEAVTAAREQLVEGLGLEDHAVLARRAFPDEPTYPIEHDEAAITRLREELTGARDRRATQLKREIADGLRAMREPAEHLVARALELDVELAIARFARDLDCVMPTFGGSGFAIENGRSPLLDVPIEEAEPVDYTVDGVTLLTGVNSGGKTATLDLVALVAVLAHMGLPVPAEAAQIERFDALHYQAKSQGTLDAGAFESTLKEFAGLATGERRRLVLVDELESITEPGASAVIVAGILEALAESNATAVFVSHLAGEIREEATVEVTVDGIEAVGLEDGELIVNRSPRKSHLARSTPELIVEKLAGVGSGANDSFYARLLEKFEE